DDALRAQTLDQIEGFGVHQVRLVLYWRDVAPAPTARTMPSFDETDPNAYPGFGRYDRAVADLRARGMSVLLTLTCPVPRWATRSQRDYVTDPSVTHWQRFVTAVGRRYASAVDRKSTRLNSSHRTISYA